MVYYVITFVKIMVWFYYFVNKMPNTRKNVGNSDTTLGENTEDSNNDFNMVMDKNLRNSKHI